MSKKLTIMFVPMEGVGHVNACLGPAEVLRDRGHKIIFLIDNSYKGMLEKYGFIEELIVDPEKDANNKPGENTANKILQTGILSGINSLEKLKVMTDHSFFKNILEKVIAFEPQLKSITEKYKPDVYIIAHVVGAPTLIYSDKPWVALFSAGPLFALDHENTPPAFSGYPTNGDKTQWKQFKELAKKLFGTPKIEYNKWLSENGYPEIQEDRCIPDSPYLNIYGYPEELDYTDVRPLPEKWFRVDAFMRKEEEELKLPQKFLQIENSNDSGKLIYVSMGSMGSIDIKLMKKLVDILAKTPHKFIVSKGPLHEKYELADNMWGQRSVPQTKVLPLVDLVITHGGNNTVTETFSCGKPMIVMPLFGDQFDNAQRIHEKGFGIRLDGYNCTESELLNAIEKLVNDKELKERLTVASNRILNSKSLIKAAELIEKLV